MKQMAIKTPSFNAKKLQRPIKSIEIGDFNIVDKATYTKQLDKNIKVI